MRRKISMMLMYLTVLAVAISLFTMYYRVYRSYVFRYRGLNYQSFVNDNETTYTSNDGTILLIKTPYDKTVTISYQWESPQIFLIQQEHSYVKVTNNNNVLLLAGVWSSSGLLDNTGSVDKKYLTQKNAWANNQQASVQQPTPPNAAEALDIAMGICFVKRGKGIAPKLIPLSALVMLFLISSEISKAQSSKRWGAIFRKNLDNPAVQVALQVDQAGEPVRDLIFSKKWLVGILYILFVFLVLLYDIS